MLTADTKDMLPSADTDIELLVADAPQSAVDGHEQLSTAVANDENTTNIETLQPSAADIPQSTVVCHEQLSVEATSGEKQKRTPYFPDVKKSADGKKITPLNTADNLQALLRFHGYNVMQNQMNLEVEFQLGGHVQNISFESLRSRLISLSAVSGLSRECGSDHIYALSEQNRYHPVKRWLGKEQWDGRPRVEQVIDCLNAKNPVTAKMVLKHWLIGCVASLYEEKFSSKLVPILVGDQSDMKTTALTRICDVTNGAYLEGAEINPDQKDSVLSAIRSWIVELGELDRTSRNNQSSMKAFITRREDVIRPPYARSDIRKPRQTNLIATVNGSGFLKDATGNSRYAVIELATVVDIERLNRLLGWHYDNGRVQQKNPRLLKQFWLEVKSWYDAGDSWNLSREQVAQLAQKNDEHSDKGLWYEVLVEKYVNVDDSNCRKMFVTALTVCEQCGSDKRNTRLIGQALSRLAKEGKIQMEVRRSNVKYYELKFPRVEHIYYG